MSGSRQIVLALSVKDADVVRKQLEAMGSAGEKALSRLDAASKRLKDDQGYAEFAKKIRFANDEASNSSGVFGRAGQAVGSFGQQMQDATVQLQMGTNALQVLAQQGSQFLGVFGTGGAIAGAVLAIGAVAAGFLTAGENAKEAEKSARESFESMSKAGKDFATVLKGINDLFLTNAERSVQSANARISDLRAQAQSLQQQLIQRNEGNTADLSKAREELSKLEDYARRQDALRERLRASGQMSPEGEAFTERGALFQARAKVQGLEQDISRTSDKIGDLNDQLKRLNNAPVVGANEFGPTSADPFGTGALRASLDQKYAAQQAYQSKLDAINEKVREGSLSAAEGDKLAAMALDQRNDAIGRLEKAATKALPAVRNLVEVQDYSGETFSRDAGVQRMLDTWGKQADAARAKELKQQEAQRDRIAKEQEVELKRREQQEARVTDNIVDYTSDRFADLFSDTKGGWDGLWESMRRTAVAMAARIAAEAVIRPVVQPIVSSLMGSTSLSGGSGAMSLTGAGGTDYLGMMKQAGGLYDSLTGASSANSYITGFNNYAASSFPGVFTPAAGAAGLGTPAAGGATFALDMSGGAAQSAMNAANPSFFGTASGTALGVAGLAAAGYGLYNAAEVGGSRGWAQGAGSVAGAVGSLGVLAEAGGTVGLALGGSSGMLAALGPYGLVAAAVLAIVSQFLPGQKPSDKTGTFARTLDTGYAMAGGLEGDRYDQANRDSAKSIADSIADIATQLRTVTGSASTPYAYEVAVGNRDGISLLGNGVTRDYSRDQAGSDQLIRDATADIINSMRAQFSANENTVVNASGGDLATILKNIDWLNNVYEPLQKVADLANPFRDQFQGIETQFKSLIDQANALGLTVGELANRQSEAMQKLMQSRIDWDMANDNSLNVRYARATGQDQLAATLEYDAQARAEQKSFADALAQWGITGQDAADRLVKLEQTQAAERLKILQDFSAQATQIEQQAAEQQRQAQQTRLSYWQASRSAEGRDYITGVESVRMNWSENGAAYSAAGLDPDRLYWQQLRAQLDQLDTTQLQDVAVSFRGLDDAAADLATQMLQLGNSTTAAVEAQKRAEAESNATGVISSLADYASGLGYGNNSALSLQDQFANAQRQFQAVSSSALAGDANSLSKLQGYSDTYLSTGRELYGSTAAYAGVFAQVRDVLGQVGNMSPDTLRASFQAQIVETQTVRFENAIASLQAEVAALRRETKLMNAKAA